MASPRIKIVRLLAFVKGGPLLTIKDKLSSASLQNGVLTCSFKNGC